MSTGQIGILAAIIIYLAAMVYVGFYFSKKGGGDSADEFYLGGRKLGAVLPVSLKTCALERLAWNPHHPCEHFDGAVSAPESDRDHPAGA